MEDLMRIAYFTDTYIPEINGVTNTLGKLSTYLEQRGIQHMFFAPDYKRNAGEISLLSDEKKVKRFKGIKVAVSPESRLAFPQTRHINTVCDEFAPDLIHVTSELGIGYRGMKYATSRRLPLIMSYHTDYCKYLEYFKMGAFENIIEAYLKWFYGFSDKTLAPSKHTLEQLRENGYKNLGIWSRGIDTCKFNANFRSTEVRDKLGIGERFAFLFVGRLSPEKGLHMLLYAIEKINTLFPEKAVFIFTGDGPYAETIRQAGFDNVIMTGMKRGQELSEIYSSGDCFAFPSGTETFGNTPLEAMASGLPIVGINGGGVTEYLVHEHNSLLCANGDKDAFTDNLITMMQNEELRRTLSKNGLETACSRDWNGIFDGLMEEYTAVIDKNGSAAIPRKRAS